MHAVSVLHMIHHTVYAQSAKSVKTETPPRKNEEENQEKEKSREKKTPMGIDSSKDEGKSMNHRRGKHTGSGGD